jgi:regulator of sigma D
MTVLLAVAALDTGPAPGFVTITSLVIAIAAAKHAKLGTAARYLANFCYYLSDSLSRVHVLIEPY